MAYTKLTRSMQSYLACGLALGAIHCSDVNTTVDPGQSIQEAVDRMPADADRWVVEVRPGVYHESLDIIRSGVEIRGLVRGAGTEERPILDGAIDSKTMRKDGMVVSGAHFTVSGFLVRNYAGNGITSQKTHHTTFRDIITDKAGKYGLYPVESEDILIENCVATNIADAGIYVGQSKRAVVRNCIAHANVAGIEIENTVDALVEGNEAYDNAGGILVFLLPGGASKVSQTCVVRDNYIHENNHKNFGDPMATVSKVPQGIGMLIMGADDTSITGNRIIGNQSMGVIIASLAALVTDPTQFNELEPNSDRTQLLNNNYKDNGKAPSQTYLDLVKSNGITAGGDLLFDGTGKGNCQDEPQNNDLVPQGFPLNRC